MIKLFASDLDGTLLNAFHKVDGSVRSAVRAVTDAGLHMAVATGRTFRATSDYEFGDLKIEVVCANGALILDRSSKIIRHRAVDPSFIEALLGAFPQACFECVGLDYVYITTSEEVRFAQFRADGLLRRIVMAGMRGRRRQMSANCLYSRGISDILSHEVVKINARIADPGLEREVHAFINEHADSVVNTPFNPVMFEITDKDVNKGEAVAWLARYLGIAEDEVAVYGDGGNDLVMLDRFKHAYAPSNGTDAAKRAAGTVIGSCRLHAVPRHIRLMVREQEQGMRYTRI